MPANTPVLETPAADAAERPLLDRVQVKSPCTVSWDSMRGGDRVRFCGECKLNVYDLSAMTRPAAEALLRGRGERLCVRFQKRADGTIVSQDCGPVRLAIRRRARLLRVAAAGLFAMFFPSLGGCGAGSPGPGTPAAPAPGAPAQADPDPDEMRPQGEVHIPESMGIVACPPDKDTKPTETPPADDPEAPPVPK